jgi:O-acetylhomoserine/O-acetylserine sulfhydrylase-like pyridoxal-dependent enzyme
MHKETQCVHSGGLRDAETGGINSPIFTSTAAEYLGREPWGSSDIRKHRRHGCKR